MNDYEMILTSAMVKARVTDSIQDFTPRAGATALRGDRHFFSALVTGGPKRSSRLDLTVESAFGDNILSYHVESIPVRLPCYEGGCDDDYLDTKPGIYPDVLRPATAAYTLPNFLTQLYFEVRVPQNTAPGKYEIKVTLYDRFKQCHAATAIYTLEVLDAVLPPQRFLSGHWFHYDCLATYYNVEIFSERHWEIVENFIKTFVKCGNNTLLTPVFTPALDTYVGGERPTVQLVGVTRDTEGKYTFDFSLLTRFMDMADRLGVKYFEIAHFFTQWGAGHAPKVMATTEAGYERIFGWDTDATGEEYTAFIRQFITELLDFLKARGDDKRCFFHISDEPQLDHLEQYMKSKNSVVDLLEDYVIMDALSNVDFYREGIIRNPIPCNNHIDPFLEAYAEEGREGLWTYYCCGQNKHVSNRFFGHPGARTRYIGVQFYRFKIGGFLQWGYNFYYNQGSHDAINPYVDSTGNYFVPSGDTYSVYPAADGTALESMRILHFREGLDDMRALYLAESLVGRDKVLEIIEPIVKEMTGENIVFARCIDRSSDMMKLRAKIDEIVMNALK